MILSLITSIFQVKKGIIDISRIKERISTKVATKISDMNWLVINEQIQTRPNRPKGAPYGSSNVCVTDRPINQPTKQRTDRRTDGRTPMYGDQIGAKYFPYTIRLGLKLDESKH